MEGYVLTLQINTMSDSIYWQEQQKHAIMFLHYVDHLFSARTFNVGTIKNVGILILIWEIKLTQMIVLHL